MLLIIDFNTMIVDFLYISGSARQLLLFVLDLLVLRVLLRRLLDGVGRKLINYTPDEIYEHNGAGELVG